MSNQRLLSAADNPSEVSERTAYSFLFQIEGDKRVGKTTLLKAYANGRSRADHCDNVVAPSLLIVTGTFDGSECLIGIHDYNQKEGDYRKPLYTGCQGVLLTFALDDRISFESLSPWMTFILSFTDKNNDYKHLYSFVVLANKCDIPEEARRVSREEIERWCEENNTRCFETSERLEHDDALKKALDEIVRRTKLYEEIRYGPNSGHPKQRNPSGSDGNTGVVPPGGAVRGSGVDNARSSESPPGGDDSLNSDQPLIPNASGRPRRGSRRGRFNCCCCCCCCF